VMLLDNFIIFIHDDQMMFSELDELSGSPGTSFETSRDHTTVQRKFTSSAELHTVDIKVTVVGSEPTLPWL